MKKPKRYDTSHLIEDQPEPGSRGRVLNNKREMDRREKLTNFISNGRSSQKTVQFKY